MVVYDTTVSEGYEWIIPLDSGDSELFASFDGTSRIKDWKPPRVRRVDPHDEGRKPKPSAFPCLGGSALVMSASAVLALGKILTANGELLPLASDDGTKLHVLNVTRILDALDEERSSIVRFAGTTTIMRIKKAVFRLSVVRGVQLFRLPHRGSRTYVGQEFVDTVKAAGLEGLEFEPVWSEHED